MNLSWKHPVISGAIHYFRIHPGEWSARLDQAVKFGLNTIETYVPWNLHEPRHGKFNFVGIADLEHFIREVAEHDLDLILRPGPYICAEWENGGFPAWLTGRKDVEIRCMNQPYLDEVEHWFAELLPRVVPFQKTSGGPICAMQVENEYGSYAGDHEYMYAVRDLLVKYGVTVPLFTSDGPDNVMLHGGTIIGTPQTVNFGSDPELAFAVARKIRPNDPDFCMEFWCGWFDHWGEAGHHVRSAENTADTFRQMLEMGANVNFYMFSGGTNFGFTAGANGHYKKNYAPTVTSYDYDAPISEAGDPTDKFEACQAVIRELFPRAGMGKAIMTQKIAPGKVKFSASADLLTNLEKLAVKSGQALVPPTMDDLGETFGFIHYHTHIDGPFPAGMDLSLFEVNDFAQVWLDGKYLGSRFRDLGENPFKLPEVGENGAELDVLVENTGRINYGAWTGRDKKGIVNCVALRFQRLLHWSYNSLDLAHPEIADYGDFAQSTGRVTLHKAEFMLDEVASTFLKRPGKKGAVWVNGFPLGRYWEIGPQQTLYVPGAALRRGRNTIIVLEQEELGDDGIEFSDHADLGPEL
jgi:beta-galactosidase